MGVVVGVKAVVENDILRNAPFRSQIFKIFFASGGKGALTSPPPTKILRTPLAPSTTAARHRRRSGQVLEFNVA